MEDGLLLSPLAGHFELAAMILRYLEPGDLITLLLLNKKNYRWLLSPQMNYFWFTEIQSLPRSYHCHIPAKMVGDERGPCKHSALRLKMRNLMCQALVTPVYCNWLHHLKCRNWRHYERLPDYDSYWKINKEKPHSFAEKNYFENWKKKVYIRMVWWNSSEHVSQWLNRQELMLQVKLAKQGKARQRGEYRDLLQMELDQLHKIKDELMPILINRVTACEELYKPGIVAYQRKNPPWVSKHFSRVYFRKR